MYWWKCECGRRKNCYSPISLFSPSGFPLIKRPASTLHCKLDATRYKKNCYTKKPLMFLAFDVETVGFPKKWNRPYSDTFNWPRMVRIAWIHYDEQRKVIGQANHIIQPEGFEIPYDSERFHKISTDKAREEGEDLRTVLKAFTATVDEATYAIAHNLNLDQNVVGAELYRKSIENRLFSLEGYCTMREGTYFCRLPGKDGRFKWPTLQELHLKLFGEQFKNAYDPIVDAEMTAKCFFKLVDMEEIDLF